MSLKPIIDLSYNNINSSSSLVNNEADEILQKINDFLDRGGVTTSYRKSFGSLGENITITFDGPNRNAKTKYI